MWTTENRPRYNRDRLRYPSDMTDAEWELIETLIPPAKRGGGKRRVDMRQVVNRVMWNCKKDEGGPLGVGDQEPAPNRCELLASRALVVPTLTQVLYDAGTVWQRHNVTLWYGRTNRVVEIAIGTAVWYRGGVPPVPMRWLLVRDPRGELPPQAFLCTDLDAASVDIRQWFVSRWQLGVTFQEVRAHLGVETQRQWSDLAIMRTTPALLGLFSLITLWAHALAADTPLVPTTAA